MIGARCFWSGRDLRRHQGDRAGARPSDRHDSVAHRIEGVRLRQCGRAVRRSVGATRGRLYTHDPPSGAVLRSNGLPRPGCGLVTVACGAQAAPAAEGTTDAASAAATARRIDLRVAPPEQFPAHRCPLVPSTWRTGSADRRQLLAKDRLLDERSRTRNPSAWRTLRKNYPPVRTG